jgi:hypothetical protein
MSYSKHGYNIPLRLLYPYIFDVSDSPTSVHDKNDKCNVDVFELRVNI